MVKTRTKSGKNGLFGISKGFVAMLKRKPNPFTTARNPSNVTQIMSKAGGLGVATKYHAFCGAGMCLLVSLFRSPRQGQQTSFLPMNPFHVLFHTTTFSLPTGTDLSIRGLKYD